MGVLSESLPFPGASEHVSDREPADLETAWIEAAKTDPRAFAPLYDRYATPIYRFCYRKVGDPDAANDLTAQVFTRAIERIDRYHARPGATFRSWLFAIARNTITDRWRRLRPTDTLDPARHTLTDHDPGPEERAVHGDELDRLLAVLADIPPNQRDIIELRLAGLTTAEVGEVLGMSRGAVKTAQSRAYKRLRDLLAPPEGAIS
ncbi:MAG TPA: sigma-70 family RNA polymerase sigma factor [Thermomicrobiales bacterium]|nr:sigma-70 family RNA polymerase sigma factor [Thermomicrobiales bacterium]